MEVKILVSRGSAHKIATDSGTKGLNENGFSAPKNHEKLH
jgi:hypothetical protein